MTKRVTFLDVVEGALLIHKLMHELCSTLDKEVHFKNVLTVFEDVLLFLNTKWVEDLANPCQECLVLLILEECNFRQHLLINDYSKLYLKLVRQLIHELSQVF